MLELQLVACDIIAQYDSLVVTCLDMLDKQFGLLNVPAVYLCLVMQLVKLKVVAENHKTYVLTCSLKPLRSNLFLKLGLLYARIYRSACIYDL